MIDSDTIARAIVDVDVFARVLVGQPLWRHQLELARSEARIRCVCSGRQAGKTRTLSIIALHEAFRAGERRVLIVSAGEDAARDLLGECSMLASSPLLAGSVIDDNTSLITLSNGSTIRSVPASVKQIRGKSIDLLIIDEACFVDHEIWRAAQYTVIARPGSKVVMASTPFGKVDRFFAVAYRAGERRAEGYASFHWPSTASPMVDRQLLRMWRETSTDREYRTEILAEWVDDSGAYFTADEIANATVDVELPHLAVAKGLELDVGVDWGRRRDATAVVGVGWLPRTSPVVVERGPVRCPLLVEAWHRLPFHEAIARIVAAGSHEHGARFIRVISEQNGIGEMPTEELRRAATLAGLRCKVSGVFTDARNKEAGFGAVRLALQKGGLVLPRHPELLRQLSSLEFEQTDGGVMRIAVPERAGHDDLAMALQLAVQPAVADAREWSAPSPSSWRYSFSRGHDGVVRAKVWEDSARADVVRLARSYRWLDPELSEEQALSRATRELRSDGRRR